ncbi:MAG: hypothetical protein AB7P03_30625 [Kofleriaceae bacterium]
MSRPKDMENPTTAIAVPTTRTGPPSKARLALIFGGVAVIMAGGVGYLLGVHQPRQRLRAAQHEIASWERTWEEARRCMLGAKPGSGTISEALAIREMSPDPWDRKTCTKLIGAILRPESDDTGIPEVEAAWLELDKAATALANAFVTHVDPDGETDRRAEDPLPAALDGFELARNALRVAAELPPQITDVVPPLPAATMIALTHDGKPVVSLEGDRITSGPGFIGFGSAASGPVQIQFVAGRAPVITAIEDTTLRAVPEPSWGARSVDGAIEIGAVDAGGEISNPVLIKVTGRSAVFAVVGSLEDGVVAYAADDGLAIARIKTGKVTAPRPVYAASPVVAANPSRGEVAIVWTDRELELVAVRLAPGNLDAVPARIGDSGVAQSACLDDQALWIQDPATLYRVRDGVLSEIQPRRSYQLAGCSGAGVVVTRPGTGGQPPLHQMCTDQCIDIVTDRGFAPVVLPGGEWAAFYARGNVLGVKRPSGTQFLATTDRFRPVVAMTDGKQIDVVGYTIQGVSVIRVPARP